MITKIGKVVLAENDKVTAPGIPARSYMLLGGSGIVGGADLARKAFASGDITGRETLYHGTLDDVVDTIKDQGVKASRAGATTHTHVLRDLDPQMYEASLGKSYFMPTKGEGALYATQANLMKEHGYYSPQQIDITEGEKELLRRKISGKGVVKVNAPTWRMQSVVNPEAAMPYAEWRYNNYEKNPFVLDFSTEAQKKKTYNNLRRARVFEGDMPAEYVVGSSKYHRLTPKELIEYAKANKLRFAKGLGKLTAGTGFAGLGAYGVYKGIDKARSMESK